MADYMTAFTGVRKIPSLMRCVLLRISRKNSWNCIIDIREQNSRKPYACLTRKTFSLYECVKMITLRSCTVRRLHMIASLSEMELTVD